MYVSRYCHLIQDLSKDIFKKHIFIYLSPEELGRASCVCKKWNVCASDDELWKAFDLQKLFPQLTITDARAWMKDVRLKKLGLDVSDEPPLNNREVIPVLKGLSQQGKKITILTIPRGASIESLMMLKPSPGLYFDVYGSYEKRVKKVDQTYRVIITTITLDKPQLDQRAAPVNFTKPGIVFHRYTESQKAQMKFLKNLRCEMPRIIEASSLYVLEHLYSIAPNNQSTIFCSEKGPSRDQSFPFSRHHLAVHRMESGHIWIFAWEHADGEKESDISCVYRCNQ